MLVKLSSSALKQTRWYEYAVRFGLGGLATVLAGAIGAHFGVSVGGLFLALPAIFCASATLIESHERHAKEKTGLSGRRRGQQAAALDSAGAALGSIGLAAFAAIFHAVVGTSVAMAFVAALAGWAVVSVAAWWLRRKLRSIWSKSHQSVHAQSAKRHRTSW
jgi:ABC-type spermidine/putrescine transport system permease subunit II